MNNPLKLFRSGISRFVALSIFPILLTGCADTVPVQPVNITGSDLCRIQPEPLTWDVADTAPTIKGVRQFNARWSSRCGSKRKGSPVS